MKKFLYPVLLIIVSLLFFYQTFIKGLLPIPADDIIGLYHPFRDLYAQNYPNGIPFKNPLITDPVRQQYPWKKLVADLEKKLEIPLWNPYSMTGTPLLANFQSSPFYPLNILLIIFPFNIGWAILIISQPILAGLFMFFYLRNQKLEDQASLLGAIVFAFCGFSVAWLEWGNVLSTGLWIPLVLLSIDELFLNKRKWIFGLIIGITFSFFAGHLQIFFYSTVLYLFYIILISTKKKNFLKQLIFVLLGVVISGILILPQVIPTLQFISLSARSVDLNWQSPGWFTPFQHLVQFLIPDFFGNPSTLNYFGTWNYAEMVGYVGIFPIIMAFLAILSKSRKVFFFWGTIVVSLLLATPNLISEIPYRINIPFLATAQPTRLMFIIDMSLSVCAAYGVNYLIKKRPTKSLLLIIFGFVLIFAAIGVVVFKNPDLIISKRNFYFPLALLLLSSIACIGYLFIRNEKFAKIITWVFIFIVAIDLFRFGWKFTPFTSSNYLFPNTKILSFLQNRSDKNFRIMSLDSEILPPNFSVAYKIQDVSGYDPLYLLSYGEFISAMDRNKPDISVPFGFNRLVIPTNYHSKLFNLLNVKYLLTFSKINDSRLKYVMSEGKTNLYENKKVLPRAFFVENTSNSNSKAESIQKIYDNNFDPLKTAVAESFKNTSFSNGTATIDNYAEDEVLVSTKNEGEGFLVLLDTYYPTWKVYIDGRLSNIYKTDYNFRGVLVPAGVHTILFKDSLL